MSRLLYVDIAQKIERQINMGKYKAGDKLPSERELAEEYGVSRNVIREVINTLRIKGYVTVSPGRGTYITKFNNLVVTETLKRMIHAGDSTGEEILEVREEFEIAIIRKAVHNATAKDIEDLKTIYNIMGKYRYFDDEFSEGDAQFHITLAKATQNRIYPLLIQSFFDMIEGSIFALSKLLSPDIVEKVQKHHRELIQAIEARDENQAVITMKAHMRQVENELKMLKNIMKDPHIS